MIYPAILGAGERLFGETSDKNPVRLVGAQSVSGGVARLIYDSVRDA